MDARAHNAQRYVYDVACSQTRMYLAAVTQEKGEEKPVFVLGPVDILLLLLNFSSVIIYFISV